MNLRGKTMIKGECKILMGSEDINVTNMKIKHSFRDFRLVDILLCRTSQ